jgi:hypothetical protein
VVVGAPIWGQDYGGALSLAPAILVWWLLDAGRRIRLGALLGVAATVLAVGVVAGLVDLGRPEGERTHVGRLFERIGDDGPGALLTTLGRKASLMIDTFGNTAWVLLVAAVLALLWLAARRTHVLADLVERIPPLRSGLIAFATLTVLATILNDSGVQITGMMLATLLPVLVSLSVGTADGEPAPDVPGTVTRDA